MAPANPAMGSLISSTSSTKAGGAAREPHAKRDRQTSNLIFERSPLSDDFLRAAINPSNAYAGSDFTCVALKNPVLAKCASPRGRATAPSTDGNAGPHKQFYRGRGSNQMEYTC